MAFAMWNDAQPTEPHQSGHKQQYFGCSLCLIPQKNVSQYNDGWARHMVYFVKWEKIGCVTYIPFIRKIMEEVRKI